jgi:RHS repeat-associated protein
MVRRVEHPTSGSDTTTLFFHDGLSDQVAEETDGSGTVQARYILDSAANVLGNDTTAAGRGYFVADLRGNLSQMLDGSQNVVATFAFGAYGEQKSIPTIPTSSGGWGSRLKYQMSPEDPKTHAYNIGGRLFAPQLTRFTSSDYYPDAIDNLNLKLDPMTENVFAYASANPATFGDDGHRYTDCTNSCSSGNEGSAKMDNNRTQPRPYMPPPPGPAPVAGPPAPLGQAPLVSDRNGLVNGQCLEMWRAQCREENQWLINAGKMAYKVGSGCVVAVPIGSAAGAFVFTYIGRPGLGAVAGGAVGCAIGAMYKIYAPPGAPTLSANGYSPSYASQ